MKALLDQIGRALRPLMAAREIRVQVLELPAQKIPGDFVARVARGP